MTSLKGKKAVVMGVAGHRSIATAAIAAMTAQGCEVIVGYLPDETGKNKTRVMKSLEPYPVVECLPCNVCDDASISGFFQKVQDVFKEIDFFIHSIAWAPLEDLQNPVLECSRNGFLEAMNVSVYSFITTSRYASNIMNPNGRVVTLSYYGGEKVIPGYNVMGVAKAALEAAVQYLAYDLGQKQITVNAVSAGPLKTLASAGISGFSKMQSAVYDAAPLKPALQHQDVGDMIALLLNDASRCMTGETLHVDCGYHILGGWPAHKEQS